MKRSRHYFVSMSLGSAYWAAGSDCMLRLTADLLVSLSWQA